MYQPYNPYAFQAQQQMQQLQNLQFGAQAQQQIIRVNGKAGADAFQMGPNCSALLMDETAPIVWMAVTDGGGYKTLQPFDISPHEEEKPVTAGSMKSLEERIAKLEEATYGKSNAADAANDAE